jgi:hypothetical protein
VPEPLTSSPPFRYEPGSREAQTKAREYTAAQLREINRETWAAAGFLITRSIADDIPTREAAKMIQQGLGLNRPQAAALLTYREGLSPFLSMAARDAALQKFIKKKIRIRAMMIARTTVLDGLNQGMMESWQQAQKEGYLGKQARKRWRTNVGACPICVPLNNKSAPLNKPFSFSLPARFVQPIQHPPAHPNCLCSIEAIP